MCVETMETRGFRNHNCHLFPLNLNTYVQPFEPSRCIKASFYIPEKTLNFSTTEGFRTKISMKLVYQYMANFCNFFTLNHLHPLQVENCDSNSRLVVDEDDNGKFRLERVNGITAITNGLIKQFLVNNQLIKIQ